MSKKLEVINSPWERPWEKVSDCDRWIAQGHAFSMPDGKVCFTEQFRVHIRHQMELALPFDPSRDDGIGRRWKKVESGVTPVMQLMRTIIVGTGHGTSKRRDMLTRRQARRDKCRSIHAESIT